MKHHYLPQFYQRGFSADGQSIFQFEKDTGRFYEVAVRDAAAIRDFHKLDHEDFPDPNAFEKQLSIAEGQFAEILSEVLNSGIANRNQHLGMVGLLNLMRVRVPSSIAHIERVLEGQVTSVAKMMERHGKLPPASKPGGSILDEVKLSIRNFKVLEFMVMSAVDPDVLRLLGTMKPTLLDAPEGSFFVTCDHPVTLYHPKASASDIMGVALIDLLTEITFPLSSRVLLKLVWSSGAPERRLATAEEVEELNRRTVIVADKYILAHAPIDAVITGIAKYGKYRADTEYETRDEGESIFHILKNRAVLAPERYS